MELPIVQYVPELIQLTTRDGLVHNELIHVNPKTYRLVRMLQSSAPFSFDVDTRRIYKDTGTTIVKFFDGDAKRIRVFMEEE